jgi:membrane protein YdbS with pleckstrin-like domain
VQSRVVTATAYWILAGFVAIGIFALNSGPIVLDVHSRDFNPIVAIPVILCLPALTYTLLAGRDWLWAGRFGTSVLDVDDIEAGGQLHGVLRTAFDIHATSDVVLRLQCIRSKEERYGGRHGTQQSVVVDDVLGEWKQKVPASGDTSGAGIPFSFALPPEMPPTAGGQGTDGAVRWALIASAPRPGLNYHAVFPIEVRSRPGVRHHQVEGAPHARVGPSGAERTLFTTRLHQAVYLRPAAWFAAAAIVRAMGFPLPSMLFVVVGLFDVIIRVLQQGNTEFAFTTYRLSMSTGTFRKRRRELALQTIESVSVKQSPIGRLLGYGTLVVTLVDGTRQSCAGVARAQELVERVQECLFKTSVA